MKDRILKETGTRSLRELSIRMGVPYSSLYEAVMNGRAGLTLAVKLLKHGVSPEIVLSIIPEKKRGELEFLCKTLFCR